MIELRQLLDSRYQVSVHYTAQTLEQMRDVTPLTLAAPPARANVFIPGCSESGEAFPCEWKNFQQATTSVIDPAFVR